MKEKICRYKIDYEPYFVENHEEIGRHLIGDVLRAVNHLLWQKGLPLEVSVVDPTDDDPEDTIHCVLSESSTGPAFFPVPEES